MNEEEIASDKIGAHPAERNDFGISEDSDSGVAPDIGDGVLEGRTIMVPCPYVDLEKKAPLISLEDWTSIRWLHFREKRSIRWIAKKFKISRKTVAKYLGEPEAPSLVDWCAKTITLLFATSSGQTASGLQVILPAVVAVLRSLSSDNTSNSSEALLEQRRLTLPGAILPAVNDRACRAFWSSIYEKPQNDDNRANRGINLR